jgi:heat shock protein HtpX
MATIYTQQSKNIRKTWFLMAVFFAMVVAIGYFLNWYFNDQSLLYVAIAFALFMNFTSYWWSHKLVVAMTGAKPANPQEHRELINVIENLSITAGLPMPKVYVVNDPAPNAFATGRNPKNAVVAATTGLLSILDRTELEGVMAHELSHVGNRDMLVSTVAVVLAGFVAIIADLFLRSMMYGGGDRDSKAGAVFLILGIVGIILAPIAAQMIQMAISRKREYLADASGALLTRYPEGLASALEKISHYSQPMKRANNATAHLFIADPFGPTKKTLGQKISNLFQTHPPAEDRIRLLREMGK